MSLTGISSLQSQQLQPPNDEAETWEGVLAYEMVDEAKPFFVHHQQPKTECGGPKITAASWAVGNWKCAADVLYMYPLPASLLH